MLATILERRTINDLCPLLDLLSSLMSTRRQLDRQRRVIGELVAFSQESMDLDDSDHADDSDYSECSDEDSGSGTDSGLSGLADTSIAGSDIAPPLATALLDAPVPRCHASSGSPLPPSAPLPPSSPLSVYASDDEIETDIELFRGEVEGARPGEDRAMVQ